MELLGHFLRFVWRSLGPQGALLYTALLIVRRAESVTGSPLGDELKPYHLAINFIENFAKTNGPNISSERLNASCAPFFVLPKSQLDLFRELVDVNTLSNQLNDSTAEARRLVFLWRPHFAVNPAAGNYETRLTALCSSLLDLRIESKTVRPFLCQVTARQTPESDSGCIQRTLSQTSSSPIASQSCSEKDKNDLRKYIAKFDKAKEKATTLPTSYSSSSSSSSSSWSSTSSSTSVPTSVSYLDAEWNDEPVFFCSRNNPPSRQWFVRIHLALQCKKSDLSKLVSSRALRRRRRRKRQSDAGGKDDLKTYGVITLFYPLTEIKINQCRTANRCKQTSPITTECEYKQLTKKFALGNYICKCRKEFYLSNSDNGFNGSYIETGIIKEFQKSSRSTPSTTESANELGFHCNACRTCDKCNTLGHCQLAQDTFRMLRDFPLGVQSFCITVCLVVMGIVFKLRRKRVIKTSGWALIEIFIFGAVLLYSTVVVMYFKPTRILCLLLPWLREVGFCITYGTLIVKVYRVLSGFQSRKAHRVCVRDKDVLRYILGIFVAVVAYMGACSAVNIDHLRSNLESKMVEQGETTAGMKFDVCRLGIWNIVAEASELLFLCWGLYYCHCVRSAPSEYSELRFITVALIMETVVSLVLHIAHHFIWYSLHPDYVYILYFIRCHLTVTITVILIIGPKLWYLHRPPPTQFGRTRALSHADSHLVQPIKLNLTSNGDIDLGEINIADMDPEDIRRELKRLYTQMEIYKTKEMRKDNPHVSKRRGGRKQTHRRFSLQPFHHKHRSHHTSASVHEEEVSKVSDGSNNSGDEGASAAERKTTS